MDHKRSVLPIGTSASPSSCRSLSQNTSSESISNNNHNGHMNKRQRNWESHSLHSRYPLPNKRLKPDPHINTHSNVSPHDQHISCALQSCDALPRLAPLMQMFMCNQQNWPTCDLDCYAMSQILNDYHHLMIEHNHDEEFEFIMNTFGHCDINKCPHILRMYHTQSNLSYQLDIIHKIHCYYLHSHDTGNKIPIEQRNKGSKCEWISNKRHMLKNDIRDPFQKRMNLKYNTLHYTCMEKFRFGRRFVYQYAGEDMNGIKVSPKYSTLKEELTTNNCFKITVSRFTNEYEKAAVHLRSHYCRKYFDSFHDDYVDPVDKQTKYVTWEFNIDYLLSLMIYSNCTNLQCEFSKTYRSDSYFKETHSVFYHLGRNLKIAIKKFGTRIAQGNINTFYHGLNEVLVFDRYINDSYINQGISIYGPLSTSSSLAVALNFSGGMVVCFEGYDDKWTQYFSMRWLSDYSYENEYLFIQNNKFYERLRIKNVITNGVEYEYLFRALQFINNLVQNISQEIIYNVKEWMEMKQLVCGIIDHKCSDFQECDDHYAVTIMWTFFKNKKEIIIDHNELKKYLFLFRTLSDFETLNKLFDHVSRIILYHVDMESFDFMTELINHLHDNKTNVEVEQIEMIRPCLENNIELKDMQTAFQQPLQEMGYTIVCYDEDKAEECISIRKVRKQDMPIKKQECMSMGGRGCSGRQCSRKMSRSKANALLHRRRRQPRKRSIHEIHEDEDYNPESESDIDSD
eukprot:219681_1